jgi:hypothetical protein
MRQAFDSRQHPSIAHVSADGLLVALAVVAENLSKCAGGCATSVA